MLTIAFLICAVAAVIGDAAFVQLLRTKEPRAFAAAGLPSVSGATFYSPLAMGQYFRFIVRREFRHFLAPGEGLRLLANVLYVLHVLVIGSAVLGVVVTVASSPVLSGKPWGT